MSGNICILIDTVGIPTSYLRWQKYAFLNVSGDNIFLHNQASPPNASERRRASGWTQQAPRDQAKLEPNI
eukprot:1637095-Heterocapsa_arctica.AAC.1